MKRSGSSNSSDSDDDKKGVEEDLFNMVAHITSSSSKKKSSGKEDILIDLMTKMSESYSKIKKENSELSARCVILENQNKVLKRQVEDFQEKLSSHESHEPRKVEREGRKEKSRFQSGSEDREEQAAPCPVPAPVGVAGWGGPSPVPPPPDMREERDRERFSRDDRERYRGEDRYERDRRDDRRDKRDRRDYDRERRRDRSRSRDRQRRDRSRSAEKERERPGRDKNDKIDLKDWSKPPEQGGVDPTLLSLKEKMRAKEELQREEESRSRWVTKEPSPPPEPVKPAEQPLPENRSSVKMSWGTAFRKTPDPQPAKKNTSYVGRMPWVKKGDSVGPEGATNGAGLAPPTGAGAGRRSKFGPPVTSGGAIPPPTIMTQAPTLGEI